MKPKLVKRGLTVLTASAALLCAVVPGQAADPASAKATAGQGKKPNILFIMGDDIGWMQPSFYHRG